MTTLVNPHPSLAPSLTVSPRHMEILRAALTLMAEHGFRGASLRELARAVGMSQPSLYHYFRTKEELAEQVISHLGAEILSRPGFADFPEEFSALPSFLAAYVLKLYDDPEYRSFIRFMFAVAPMGASFREAIRRLYQEPLHSAAPLLMRPFVERGDLSAEDAVDFVGMVFCSVGLKLIEHRVLYGEDCHSAEVLRYVDFVVRTLSAPRQRERSGA